MINSASSSLSSNCSVEYLAIVNKNVKFINLVLCTYLIYVLFLRAQIEKCVLCLNQVGLSLEWLSTDYMNANNVAAVNLHEIFSFQCRLQKPWRNVYCICKIESTFMLSYLQKYAFIFIDNQYIDVFNFLRCKFLFLFYGK